MKIKSFFLGGVGLIIIIVMAWEGSGYVRPNHALKGSTNSFQT